MNNEWDLLSCEKIPCEIDTFTFENINFLNK